MRKKWNDKLHDVVASPDHVLQVGQLQVRELGKDLAPRKEELAEGVEVGQASPDGAPTTPAGGRTSTRTLNRNCKRINRHETI